MKLLPNSLFDNGSLECYNFWLATTEGLESTNLSFLEKLGLLDSITKRVGSGFTYLEVPDDIYVGEVQLLEIQWDNMKIKLGSLIKVINWVSSENPRDEFKIGTRHIVSHIENFGYKNIICISLRMKWS